MIGKLFKHRITSVIGIYFDGEKIYSAELRLQTITGDIGDIVENDEIVDVEYVFDIDNPRDQWAVTDSIETLFDAIELGDELPIRAEKIAEKVSVLCSTRDWQTSATAMCLNQNDVIVDFDDFSNIPPNEIPNAVRYQIAAAGNFDIDNFYCAYVELDGRVWSEGIAKSDVEAWRAAWRKNELEPVVITALPDEFDRLEGIAVSDIELTNGLTNAIGVARIAAMQLQPNFLSNEIKQLTGWDFRKLAAAVAACTLIGLSTMFGIDRRNYNLAVDELIVEKNQLDDLDRDQRLKNFIERDLEELDARNQLLAALSKEVFPWRSVLIHFGAFHVDGVWINELKGAADKSIELHGEAIGYEAMSQFITTLESDRDFFKHEPKIVSSQSARGGKTVEFIIRIPML